MKTRLLATAALGAALGASMPAEAEGLYVGAFGGVSILEDSDLSVDNAGLSYDVEVDSDTGWALGGTLGYVFDFGLRTEAELAYRRNDLDKFHVTNPLPSTVSVDGDTTALRCAVNRHHTEVVDALVDAGVRPSNSTFLSDAVLAGDVEIVRRLLDAGAQPSPQDLHFTAGDERPHCHGRTAPWTQRRRCAPTRVRRSAQARYGAYGRSAAGYRPRLSLRPGPPLRHRHPRVRWPARRPPRSWQHRRQP